jgi:hypothetical protein
MDVAGGEKVNFAKVLLVLVGLIFSGSSDYMLHSLWNDGRAQPPFRYISADSVIDSASALERFPWEWNFLYQTSDTTSVESPDSLVTSFDSFVTSGNIRNISTATTGSNHFYASGKNLYMTDSGITSNFQIQFCYDTLDTFAVPQIWIQATIYRRNISSSLGNSGFIGFASDTANWFGTEWKGDGNYIAPGHEINGIYSSDGGFVDTVLADSVVLAYDIIGVKCNLYRVLGNKLKFLENYSVPFDLRKASVRHVFRPVVGVFKTGPLAIATYSAQFYRVGSFGYFGRRDQLLVINTDGTPYKTDSNSVYYTFTGNDWEGPNVNYAGSYYAISKLNLTTFQSTQIGLIFTNLGDTLAANDFSGPLIHTTANNFELYLSNWSSHVGNNLTLELHSHFSSSPLRGTSLVHADTVYFGTDTTSYAPYMTFDSTTNRWWATITRSPDVTIEQYTSSDRVTWTPTGQGWYTGYEGSLQMKVGGTQWIITGGYIANPDTGFYCASLYNFRNRGVVDIRTPYTTGSSSANPFIMPIIDGDSVIAVTFDTTRKGSQTFLTWGNLRYYKSPRYRN